MAATLLTPGTIAGSSWFLSDDAATLFKATEQGKAGQFVPTVPEAERFKIQHAYRLMYDRWPTTSEIANVYMAKRGQRPTARSE